jgi:hypothetical protein
MSRCSGEVSYIETLSIDEHDRERTVTRAQARKLSRHRFFLQT